jgi:hypothetical protein
MSEINFQTILADIRANRAEEKWRRLKQAAVYEFARINGWRTGPKICFPLEAIGKRNGALHSIHGPVFDHCTYYRGNGRNAAIVSEPYLPDCRDQAARLAAKLDIELHVPPNPQASIWSPGHAFFLVFTERGHEIKWLPEQLVEVRA